MARPVGAAGKRDHRICTALTTHEVVALDAMRGHMDYSSYLRYLIREERKRKLAADQDTPETP